MTVKQKVPEGESEMGFKGDCSKKLPTIKVEHRFPMHALHTGQYKVGRNEAYSGLRFDEGCQESRHLGSLLRQQVKVGVVE